eukprot:3426060-Alexandrium_andersonii.AAC.1
MHSRPRRAVALQSFAKFYTTELADMKHKLEAWETTLNVHNLQRSDIRFMDTKLADLNELATQPVDANKLLGEVKGWLPAPP